MPPTRRRPVPSTPTGRPRVAGLRKRADHPAGEPAESVVPPPFVEDVADTPEPVDLEAADTARIEAKPEPEDVRTDVKPARRPANALADVKPTGRRKRAGEPVATSVLADPKPAGPKTADVESAGSTAAGRWLPIGLVALAVALLALGVWFHSRIAEVKYNEALVDSAGTTEVSGQVREAVEKAFSYNFADVAATEKAANELLVGKAQCQYNAIFGPVKTLAPEQKLVVTVKAVSSGVTSLDGDHATVLLFLDQVTTRTTDNQSGGGIAMMRASARKSDGRWKVDNMEMFGQSGDQSAAVAKCS